MLNSGFVVRIVCAAAVAGAGVAAQAAAKEGDRARSTNATVSVASMATVAPTQVKAADARTQYCFSQRAAEGSIKTTCRTKRQWSDKGITVLTD